MRADERGKAGVHFAGWVPNLRKGKITDFESTPKHAECRDLRSELSLLWADGKWRMSSEGARLKQRTDGLPRAAPGFL